MGTEGNKADTEHKEIVLKKPLTTWEKVKTGVVSFVSSVMNYIPKGIIMSAVMVGISSLIASAGGWNIMGTFAEMGLGGFLQRTAMVVAFGSIINGSLGAYKGIKADIGERNKEIELQQKVLLRERKRSRAKEQDKGSEPELDEELITQHGLPQELSKSTLGIT